MAEAEAEWAAVVEKVTPHVSQEWLRHATEYGDQSWIRLILLVDAHAFISQPRITEKVAMTMADLASTPERAGERAGWEAVAEKSREERVALVGVVVDSAAEVLPETLIPLFHRSIEPATAMM